MSRTVPPGPAGRHEAVVVTGVGAVTPYGIGAPALIDGLYSGTPTARRITLFDPSQHVAQIACEVPGFEPATVLPQKTLSQLDRFARFGLIAAEEALDHAGLLAGPGGEPGPPLRRPITAAVDATRVATLITSSAVGVGELAEQQSRLVAGGPRRVRGAPLRARRVGRADRPRPGALSRQPLLRRDRPVLALLYVQ